MTDTPHAPATDPPTIGVPAIAIPVNDPDDPLQISTLVRARTRLEAAYLRKPGTTLARISDATGIHIRQLYRACAGDIELRGSELAAVARILGVDNVNDLIDPPAPVDTTGGA